MLRLAARGVSASVHRPQFRHLNFSTASDTKEALPPDLSNLDQRWPKMKELDQADILDYLEAKSAGDWKQLSEQEKRALYYISYGAWGPRSGKHELSTSAVVLKNISRGVALIALGVALTAFADDFETQERLDALIADLSW